MRHLKIIPLIFLSNIVIIFVLMEVLLRMAAPVPLTGYQYQPCIFAYDNNLGYRYKAGAVGRVVRFHEIDNVVKINDIGFHNVDRKALLKPTHQANEPVRILAFGDSFTAAIQVPIKDGWTRKLEQELVSRSGLSAKGRAIQVINMGLGGTGTDVHLKLMQEWVAKFKPDLVVLAFFFNDVGDNWRKLIHYSCYRDFILGFQFDHQEAALKTKIDEQYPFSFLTKLYRTFYAVQALNTYLHFSPNLNVEWAKPIAPKDNLIKISALFAEMKSLVAAQGAELIIVPVPAKPTDPPYPESAEVARQPALEAQVRLLDVRPNIQADLDRRKLTLSDMYWRHDGHFNQIGNAIFARATADKLHPIVKGLTKVRHQGAATSAPGR
ncbi:MAG: hypothetical protein HOB79_02370 [Rhodospirillaceae bacterium]|jgi:hypothetical protein|nr:hypothetical protein [Rhodospirillaceae bacterium]